MSRKTVSNVLKRGLYTRVVGRRILSFEELASTMDEALKEALAGTEEGTVVLAGRQTAGRGRFQRPWVSEPGNLLLSVVLYPSMAEMPFLSMMAGLAVARTVQRETGLQPSIKWPNDVLLGGRKVCGLLVEDALEGDVVRYALVGIGLNVALAPEKYPEIAEIATSLNREKGTEVDVSSVLRTLLHELDAIYVEMKEGRTPVLEWRGFLETLGRRVEVMWGDEVVTGYAEGVDEMGHLLLRRDDGSLAELSAGEVTFQMNREEHAE